MTVFIYTANVDFCTFFTLFFNFDDVLKHFFVKKVAAYINIWNSHTLMSKISV